MNALHLDDDTSSDLAVVEEYALCCRRLVDLDICVLHREFEERRLGTIPSRSNGIKSSRLRPISYQTPSITAVDGGNANFLKSVLQGKPIVEHMVAVGKLNGPSWRSKYTLVVLNVELWVDFRIIWGMEIDAFLVIGQDVFPSPILISDSVRPHLHGSNGRPVCVSKGAYSTMGWLTDDRPCS